MVIARTELDVPSFLLLPGSRPRRSIAVADSGGRIRQRIGMWSRRAAAAVTSVFSRQDPGGSAPVRHQPALRPAFLEGAAMSREMFRL